MSISRTSPVTGNRILIVYDNKHLVNVKSSQSVWLGLVIKTTCLGLEIYRSLG